MQRLEFDLDAVAILNLCEQIAGNGHDTPLLLALCTEETRRNFRDGGDIYLRRGDSQKLLGKPRWYLRIDKRALSKAKLDAEGRQMRLRGLLAATGRATQI